MKKIVTFAHELMLPYIKQDGIAADFTLGLGNDTIFLAKQPQLKKVYAFDIQATAIQSSVHSLKEANIHHVACIHDGHEHCDLYIQERICVGIFNFGYLPHGDPTITTLVKTSAIAVQKALQLLDMHGLLVLVIYPGHANGVEEQHYFDSWSEKLDPHLYSVLRLAIHNKKTAPYIIAIEKHT